MTGQAHHLSKTAWVAVAGAIAVLALVVAIVVSLWQAVGDVPISAAGWIAMVLGVLVTAGLGIGLMTLVFISNRRGYDEPGGDQR